MIDVKSRELVVSGPSTSSSSSGGSGGGRNSGGGGGGNFWNNKKWRKFGAVGLGAALVTAGANQMIGLWEENNHYDQYQKMQERVQAYIKAGSEGEDLFPQFSRPNIHPSIYSDSVDLHGGITVQLGDNPPIYFPVSEVYSLIRNPDVRQTFDEMLNKSTACSINIIGSLNGAEGNRSGHKVRHHAALDYTPCPLTITIHTAIGPGAYLMEMPRLKWENGVMDGQAVDGFSNLWANSLPLMAYMVGWVAQHSIRKKKSFGITGHSYTGQFAALMANACVEELPETENLGKVALMAPAQAGTGLIYLALKNAKMQTLVEQGMFDPLTLTNMRIALGAVPNQNVDVVIPMVSHPASHYADATFAFLWGIKSDL